VRKALRIAAWALSGAVLSVPVRADDAALKVEVDARKIGLDDQMDLTITIEGPSLNSLEDVQKPALQNLRIAGGPSVSTQVSIVNGAMSQARVYRYVLRPTAVGAAEIGPVHARFSTGEKTSSPIAIEVVPGSIRPKERRPSLPTPFGPAGEDPFESFFGGRRPRREPKLLVEARPSRTTLHVGEPLLLSYQLLTQTSVSDLRFLESPQYPGFWSEDVPKGKDPPGGQLVTVDGEEYQRFTFLQKLLYPTRAGRLLLPAVKLRIGIPRQGFFDDGIEADRATKPFTVDVQAIPEEQGFSGAVGKFKATTGLDRNAVTLGEAVTLRFRVEGGGNLKWIDRGPEVTVPGAKVYPPQVKSELKADASGINGAKTWEFVVVPETGGTLEVPALPFAFFDPEAGRIVRSQTSPLTLSVQGPAATALGGAPAPVLPAPTIGGKLPLRSDLEKGAVRLPMLGGRVMGAAVVLLLMGHVGIWAGTRIARRTRLDEGRVAPRRSVRAALHDLDRARGGGMSKEAAAVLIEKALADVFGAVDGAGGGAATTGERDRAVRELLQDVQFVRYAPQLGDYSEKLRELALRAGEVVRRWA
jgi:BatD DUF11 like domain